MTFTRTFFLLDVFHGKNGPWPVSILHHRTPLVEAWLEAGRLHGYTNDDYNGRNQKGKQFYEFTDLLNVLIDFLTSSSFSQVNSL